MGDSTGEELLIRSGFWRFRLPSERGQKQIFDKLGSAGPPDWLELDFLTGIVPHEVAHWMFMSLLPETVLRDGEDSYGSSLPDWYEEAVAVSAEPEEMRRHRLARLGAMRPTPSLRAVVGYRYAFAGEPGGAHRVADDWTVPRHMSRSKPTR